MATTNTTKKIVSNFLVILFGLFFNTILIGQNFSSENKATYKTISFGEKINFGMIENSVNWAITNMSEKKIVNLSGNQINDFVFEKSGQYQIKFSETVLHSKEDCSHQSFPEIMIIEVSASKITFDFSKITFSKNIQLGNNQDVIISVPVSISNKENKISKTTLQNLTIAGLGSELIATPLQKEIVLQTGTQILKFSVSGAITSSTYLMFDFVDNNNQVQTYNLPQIIN
jgi:hypothetical protein